VHPNDFEKQVERTFQNIRTSLAAAGATGEDVVRVRLYIVDFDAEKHWPIVGSAMARHLGDKGPVATMVGIQALAEPGILFEADVTAVIR
jgi:enamine deaminase RidA (YjgF/YER057c/UK114 family)